MTALHLTFLSVLLGVSLLFPGVGGPIGAACIWAACLAILAWSHPNGVLSPASLYLTLLGVFHLGLVVPVAAGLARLVDPPTWLRSPRLAVALGLFSTATVAFTLGARARTRRAAEAEAAQLPPQRELFWVGTTLALGGAVVLWLGVRQLGIMSTGYDAYFEGALANDVRLFGFGMMLFPIGVLVAAAGATPREMLGLAALVGIVLGPLFLVGFRGPVIVQVAALLALWTRKDRRIARKVAFVVLGVAIALVPAVRISRDLGPGIAPGVRSIDPVQMLLETGGSLYPLVVTAERIDSGAEEPWMGRSYAMAARRLVPNVATRRERPGARALTPSAWATMHADPWAYDHGGGIGFSGVAEPYLNFGTAGVVVFFLVLGHLVHLWDRSPGKSPYLAAVGAATFGFVLWTVRNDAMEVVRAAALAVLAAGVAWLVARLRPKPIRPAAALHPDPGPAG